MRETVSKIVMESIEELNETLSLPIEAVETTNSEASLVALGQYLGLVQPTEGCD